MPKQLFDRLGTARDADARTWNIRQYEADKILLARRFIFDGHHGVASSAVDNVLKPISITPHEVSKCLEAAVL